VRSLRSPKERNVRTLDLAMSIEKKLVRTNERMSAIITRDDLWSRVIIKLNPRKTSKKCEKRTGVPRGRIMKLSLWNSEFRKGQRSIKRLRARSEHIPT